VRLSHPLHSFLQLVIDEEREVLGRARVEVQEILEVSGDRLLEQTVVVEGLLKEPVEPGLQVQQALEERRRGRGGDTRRGDEMRKMRGDEEHYSSL